ncbi:DUF3261 domain-containing protein [Pseudenhygromyxa sp. WMMC2535]|uniref:DUF3261 domain-containing protein n=1 Tax=Pseudenhygromyxa sp. WMMC2535 TaxID=2712867 RepID=UPI0015558BCA|nr:DUF3261 domain-containing protein [Pseudenhygromyxa sp. WMMC2535]NVB42508.1 DUF3261 domain-containing protein [Pseudenhygromyxa sp. WMMC2535]
MLRDACKSKGSRACALALTLLSSMSLGCRTSGSADAPGSSSASERAVADADEGQGAGEAEPPGYPGELISTTALTDAFLVRQKLSGRYGERKFSFEAVLQLRDGQLTVLGLTPFGAKAFVLEQRGTEVDFRALIDRDMPFPPAFMLQDIHRVWLWHHRLPWGAGPPAEDQPVVEIAGERVREEWSEGVLNARSFERLDGSPAGTIRVEYVGGQREGAPAERVILDNGWFGYRLEIETVEWRSL